MKLVFLLVFILLSLGCSLDKRETVKNTSSFINSEIEKFERSIEEDIIEPTAVINLDSNKVSFLGFNIETRIEKARLIILLNNEELNLNKLETLNEVWGKRDSLEYANFLSQIKYYKYHNLMSFQLTYDPCTGLGCGVNYQIIYDLKTKKVYPFGRFRTGFEMNIYSFINDKIHYLSKSFYGRNGNMKDTIAFQIYQIGENQEQFLKPYYAKFIYRDENYEKPIKFIKNWINK